MCSWYVTKSKRRQERLLIASLRSFGAEVYFPRIVRPGSGGKKKEPLFPTYLFCCVDTESSSWPALRWAPGLAYFLGGARGGGVIPDSVVSEIQSRTDEWNRGGYKSSLAPHSRVKVTGGPFQGFEGLFCRYLPANERCVIFLKLMSRYVGVEVAADAVRENSHDFSL